MRYLRVHWNHEIDDSPILLLSELDEGSYEVRKIEIFRDGSLGFVDPDHESGSTFLSDTPIPPLDEIALDPQFKPKWVERKEFETLWESACPTSQRS